MPDARRWVLVKVKLERRPPQADPRGARAPKAISPELFHCGFRAEALDRCFLHRSPSNFLRYTNGRSGPGGI